MLAMADRLLSHQQHVHIEIKPQITNPGSIAYVMTGINTVVVHVGCSRAIMRAGQPRAANAQRRYDVVDMQILY